MSSCYFFFKVMLYADCWLTGEGRKRKFSFLPVLDIFTNCQLSQMDFDVKKKDNDLELFIVNALGLHRQNMHEVQLLLVLSY